MTADIAVLAMAAVALADMILRHRHDMRVADRLRLVNPAKAPAQPAAEAGTAAAVEEIGKRRAAS